MKPSLPGTFDKNPDICSHDKPAEVISGTTVMRKRTPTNLHTASKNVNFVFDHSRQAALVPDRNPKVSVEATQTTRYESAYRTMNRSGKPFAMGTMVGGSADDPGVPFDKSPKAKLIRG